MSVKIPPAEKAIGQNWSKYFKKVIEGLQKQGKINPKHGEEMKKYYRIYNFANQSALHINEVDGIVRISEDRKHFLKTNPDIDSDLLDEIWFDMLVVSTLRCYWLIEVSLIALLKDVQYGRRGIVEGTENLGKLKKILADLGYDNRYIHWPSIDITFRNSLAHGWYYRKKQKFIFYNNSKLKNGKLHDHTKLIKRCRLVQIYSLVIAGMVGNWDKVEDFGSKDPLK